MEVSILIRANNVEELSAAINYIADNIKSHEETICVLEVDQCTFIGAGIEVFRSA